MPIDMSTLKPVGEFGSKAWGEACVKYGIQLLEEGDIPSDTNWGFSEDYSYPPARLMEGGREKAGYYLMVKDGVISGGDGIIDEVLSLPGFHAKLPWASIANQSGFLYGREGQRLRSADEKVMWEEIEAYVGKSNPLGLELPTNAVWPPTVGAALGAGSEEGGGLHNVAATLQTSSPEFAFCPLSEMGVPIFGAMSDDQKKTFLALCGVTVD